MGKITPTYGSHNRRGGHQKTRAAAPGHLFIIFFGRCPQDYIICRAMETDCLRFTDGHPLLRVAPTSLPIRRRKICGGFLRVAKN